MALRPTSSTDAWFMLNLLSSIPFIQDLPFTSTMELLELARVQTFHSGAVVLKACERKNYLCVVWEGDLIEQPIPLSGGSFYGGALDSQSLKYSDKEDSAFQFATSPLRVTSQNARSSKYAIWHAGDWTGPLTFQPDFSSSSAPMSVSQRNIIANSKNGVKIIKISVVEMDFVLKSGSKLYNKYIETMRKEEVRVANGETPFMELLESNSALRRLTPNQKRHLEALSSERWSYEPGGYLWKRGDFANHAFIIVR